MKLVSLGAMLALAITALGGSTATLAANESRVTFVNGIAGKAIDICLNGKEVKSGLKYGAVTSRVRDNGTYKLKVFKKDARKCKGTLLGQTTLDLTFDDLTVVATKRFPKIVVFENAGVPPFSVRFAVRVASDLGPVAIKYETLTSLTPTPAADPVWTKGSQAVGSIFEHYWLKIHVTRPDKLNDLVVPKAQFLAVGQRKEWVVVGDKRKNARIVTFHRPLWTIPL